LLLSGDERAGSLTRLRAAALMGLGGAAFVGFSFVRARRVAPLDAYPGELIGGAIGSGEKPLRVAWIGDSTGAGVGASHVDHVLPRRIMSGLDLFVDLHVLAVSGARTQAALVQQLPAVRALKPDWVFVAIGSNDVFHMTPRRRFRREFAALLSGIAALQPARIVVLGLGHFGKTIAIPQPVRALAGARGVRFDADIREVVARHGALYVDLRILARGATRADLVRTHARDRFHPSDDGYAMWADATIETLVRAGFAAHA